MARLRVHNFSVSADGFGAGPRQGADHPLGVGGERLHEWIFKTRFGRAMIGESGGATGVDNDHLVAGDTGIGATIMGRNMFGPIRGVWGDAQWRGWWGDNPPYHHPVFVLTHHPHDPIEMAGGTTFFFTADPIDSVLARALEAARDKDVRLGGGVATIRQYLQAGLIDDLHLAIVPTLLGSGERLFADVDAIAAGYDCVGWESSPSVLHVRLARRPLQ